MYLQNREGVRVITRPVIGITVNFDYHRKRIWLPDSYARSVESAGGVPLLIPPLKIARPFLWSCLQGIIFSGGGDISPLCFNREPLPGLGEVDPERDDLELYLVREALERELPLMGICRGMQLLNVAAGGTVIQHLGTDGLQHFQKSRRCHPSHTVNIVTGSRLATITGEGVLPVNSFHHQAVEHVAPVFRKTAFAPDGVVEAIESRRHRFVLGLQWHPECLVHPSSAALFRELVRAAACPLE